MYVVAGVTGNTGKVVAETLLEQKQPVRVIVRDAAQGTPWQAKGAEVVVASLDDAAAITKALTGAEGAYLLVPPQYGSNDMLADQAKVIAALATAVKASGIKHVVGLSSLGAQHESGTGPVVTLHRFEEALKATGTNVTLLRAAYFIENVGQVLGEVTANSVYPTFLAVGPAIAMVATHDIGRTAAELLRDPATSVRIVDLAGPKDHTQQEIADTLSKLTGREVKLAPAPLEYAVPAFTSMGMPQNVAELFHEMLGALNAGNMGLTGSPATLRLGEITVEQVLAGMLKHANA